MNHHHISMKRLCPKCKHEISPLDKSCPGCGMTLRWGSPKPASQRVATTGAATGEKSQATHSETVQSPTPLKTVGMPGKMQVASKSLGANSQQATLTDGKILTGISWDVRFLGFFSKFCYIAIGVTILAALLVFFVPVGEERSWSGYGYGEYRYTTVTLFSQIKFALTFLGDTEGLEVRYWIWVVLHCCWLWAWALYSKSVGNAVTHQANALGLFNHKAMAGSSGVFRYSEVFTVLGILLGIASLVGAVASFCNDLDVAEAVTLCLLSLIFGGTAAIFLWALGSLFALQSWNEGAAKEIAISVKSEMASSGNQGREANAPPVNPVT